WRRRAGSVEIEVVGRPWFAGASTTVVLANGQVLRGADIVPRGHPGDGRWEVQVYELRRRERRAMRRRLTTGAHVPHPRIRSRTARRVEIGAPHDWALEVDGVRAEPVRTLMCEVVPAAFRLLV